MGRVKELLLIREELSAIGLKAYFDLLDVNGDDANCEQKLLYLPQSIDDNRKRYHK